MVVCLCDLLRSKHRDAIKEACIGWSGDIPALRKAGSNYQEIPCWAYL